MAIRLLRIFHDVHRDRTGSAAVEYVGLGLVSSMVVAALATAIDSAFGQRLAEAILTRLLEQVGG